MMTFIPKSPMVGVILSLVTTKTSRMMNLSEICPVRTTLSLGTRTPIVRMEVWLRDIVIESPAHTPVSPAEYSTRPPANSPQFLADPATRPPVYTPQFLADTATRPPVYTPQFLADTATRP